MNKIENLLELLALHGGTIVSTASLKSNEIDQARAGGRMSVDSNSLGYVWMPSTDDFLDTIEKVEQFEKWFPLDEKLPDKLKNLDWLYKREPTTSLPSDEVEFALKLNKYIHDQCIDGTPHDIGWNVMKMFSTRIAEMERELKDTKRLLQQHIDFRAECTALNDPAITEIDEKHFPF